MLKRIGKYEILRTLGQGAMGEVYLANHPVIGREVAIKTILPGVARGEEAEGRFRREAEAAGRLNHPNLVTVYDFDKDQEVLYLVMEYVHGDDLEDLIRERALTPAQFLEVLAQVCDGLAYAHRHGIIHRDIKPANVRVVRDGKLFQAKVMDFGIARVADSNLTATGLVMGTVSYMAPEYIREGRATAQSDLFAVGVMLYESLTGRKPFAGDNTTTILFKIVSEEPPPLDLEALHGISPSVRNVLARALAKEPAQRFGNADELARALRACKDPTWSGVLDEATARLARLAAAPAAGQAAAAATTTVPPVQGSPASAPPAAGTVAGSQVLPAGGAGSPVLPAGGAGSPVLPAGGAGTQVLPAGGAGTQVLPAGGAGGQGEPGGAAPAPPVPVSAPAAPVRTRRRAGLLAGAAAAVVLAAGGAYLAMRPRDKAPVPEPLPPTPTPPPSTPPVPAPPEPVPQPEPIQPTPEPAPVPTPAAPASASAAPSQAKPVPAAPPAAKPAPSNPAPAVLVATAPQAKMADPPAAAAPARPEPAAAPKPPEPAAEDPLKNVAQLIETDPRQAAANLRPLAQAQPGNMAAQANYLAALYRSRNAWDFERALDRATSAGVTVKAMLSVPAFRAAMSDESKLQRATPPAGVLPASVMNKILAGL